VPIKYYQKNKAGQCQRSGFDYTPLVIGSLRIQRRKVTHEIAPRIHIRAIGRAAEHDGNARPSTEQRQFSNPPQ
jgi:hypothetical protein